MYTSWSKADIHIHTHYSDGMNSVAQVLQHVAEHTDLKVIAITDHDTIEGALEARQIAGSYYIDVIIGEEVSTIDGHILALFIEERIAPNQPVAATIEQIHAQGGLAIPAHPCGQLVHSIGRKALERYCGGPNPAWPVDAVEAFNASLWNSRNNTAAALATAALGLPACGGSDAHSLATIGLGYTSFPGYTAGDLRAAICSGQVRAEGISWGWGNMRAVGSYLLKRGMRDVASRAMRPSS